MLECVSEHTLFGDVVPVDAASHRVSCGSRQEIHQNRVRIRVGEARAFAGRRAVPNRPSRQDAKVGISRDTTCDVDAWLSPDRQLSQHAAIPHAPLLISRNEVGGEPGKTLDTSLSDMKTRDFFDQQDRDRPDARFYWPLCWRARRAVGGPGLR